MLPVCNRKSFSASCGRGIAPLTHRMPLCVSDGSALRPPSALGERDGYGAPSSAWRGSMPSGSHAMDLPVHNGFEKSDKGRVGAAFPRAIGESEAQGSYNM